MLKQNQKQTMRVRNLIVVCSLTAIVLTVSTFAWFIGMRTVNVSSFDIEIAATDSLLLSLDGAKWDTTVAINQGNLEDVSYSGHTNRWGGKGLFPVSSVGDMDTAASRMILYEKASLTATPGGYRLMASRIHNYDRVEEQDGYVAFDLFIHNFSGNQYIKEENTRDEEAIYLTLGSEVKVATDGVANTGIENSVRVAFAQIGRVVGTTTNVATITGINCAPDGNGVPSVIGELTGICRTAQIWEPNDVDHEANAISWYNTSCRARKAGEDGADVTSTDSFNGACGSVSNTVAYPTYAVRNAIYSSDNVDIYDGPAYNTYERVAPVVPRDALLYAYPYFTDTMKEKTGTNRPPFMTLEPNSITKVRVYIYIEGQDVDNYDFASIGKKISVQFGFTKERYTENDIHYGDNSDAPPTAPGTDHTKPVITLNPADPEVPGVFDVTIAQGEVYHDAGATATDDVDGNINTWIQVTNPVNTAVPGVYRILYMVSDTQGNYANVVTRTVTVTP